MANCFTHKCFGRANQFGNKHGFQSKRSHCTLCAKELCSFLDDQNRNSISEKYQKQNSNQRRSALTNFNASKPNVINEIILETLKFLWILINCYSCHKTMKNCTTGGGGFHHYLLTYKAITKKKKKFQLMKCCKQIACHNLFTLHTVQQLQK